MSGWVSPDPWACDVCPAKGRGGRSGKDAHIIEHHMASPSNPKASKPAKGVVPEGVDPAAVRAWAKENGWPNLGCRGRLPQQAIDNFMAARAARPAIHHAEQLLEDWTFTWDHHRGDLRIAAPRLGMSVSALSRALHRFNERGACLVFHGDVKEARR